jgi:hypothetical protein
MGDWCVVSRFIVEDQFVDVYTGGSVIGAGVYVVCGLMWCGVVERWCGVSSRCHVLVCMCV